MSTYQDIEANLYNIIKFQKLFWRIDHNRVFLLSWLVEHGGDGEYGESSKAKLWCSIISLQYQIPSLSFDIFIKINTI
jgi:hypothetical protein